MARGTLRFDDKNLIGMLGMHGCYSANMAMSETDLIIAVGARFDDRVTGKLEEFGKNAKIIHIDIDPASIGKLVSVHLPIVGDVDNIISNLLTIVKENGVDSSKYQEWRERIAQYNRVHPLTFSDSDEVIKPQWVIQRVGEVVGEDAVISTDVGQHQMWVAQFYPFSFPRQYITSGGLGTMGFGLPASMGVQKAREDKLSINFSGDGSILMNIQELMTIVENKIPLINIVLNNNFLGMVRQWQTFFYDKRYASTDLSTQPDFIKLAESFGAVGFRCSTKEEFNKALASAIESKKPTFIDVVIDRLENVLPMVPSGGSLYNMMLDFKE